MSRISLVSLMLFIVLILLRFNLETEQLPGIINEVDDFILTSQNGETISKLNLFDKYTIIDFIFTECVGTCPLMTGHMKELYDFYEDSPDVQFFSISVDPESDTKSVLSMYARNNGVYDKRWMFLFGDLDFIKRFSSNSFNLISDYFPAGHSKKFFLIDKNGNVRQFYNGTNKKDIDLIKNHLNQFLALK
jgi:protein SCO1